jgi:SAM-dependent methyltransferase
MLIGFPVRDGYAALERRMERWRDHAGRPDWIAQSWPEVIGTLRLLKAQLSPTEWEGLRSALRGSELASVALEDPMSRWSWERPRGLRADAELIDMVYGHASQRARIRAASSIGRQVHAAVFALPSLAAMRNRVAVFRGIIDRAGEKAGEAHVLSIGAGHLRSAENWRAGALPARWVALEPDPLAIPVLAGQHGVEAVQGSIGSFIRRPRQHGQFDLITCGGTTDLMDDAGAARLAAAAYAALRPGGRIVLASTAQPLADRAYLDVFMDWRPGWRDEARLEHILAAAPGLRAARWRHMRKAGGRLIFTEVRKPAEPPRARAA